MICDDRSGSWLNMPTGCVNFLQLLHADSLMEGSKSNRTLCVVDTLAATGGCTHLAAGRLLRYWWQYPDPL